MYSLYLYFLGLSLRNTSKALSIFGDRKKRSYVSIWNWIQRFGSDPIYRRKRISACIIDEFLETGRLETLLSVDNNRTCWQDYARNLLAKDERRNMLVAGKFLESLIGKYGRHPVYSDGGTWYPEACNVLGLKHYLHSPYENL